MNTDRAVATACRAIDVSLIAPAPGALRRETEPGAIAADQEEAVFGEIPSVRRAWLRFDCEPTDAQLIDCLSHATDLPRWSVHRHLAALGVIPPPRDAASPAEKNRVGDRRVKAVVGWLATQSDYAGVDAIARGAKLTRAQVKSVLQWEAGRFCRVRRARKRGNELRMAYQIYGFRPPPGSVAASA